jgi:hypothetical protein
LLRTYIAHVLDELFARCFIDGMNEVLEKAHLHFAIAYEQFSDARERELDIASRGYRTVEDLQHVFDALLDLIARVARLSLNGEIVQRMHGHGAIDRIPRGFKAVILSDFLREDEHRSLDEEILVMAHVDAFLDETERSEAGDDHTLNEDDAEMELVRMAIIVLWIAA